MSDPRVAIVGAGALGSVYGVHLALHGSDVTFVVRPERLSAPGPMRIQRVGAPEPRVLASPARASTIPPSADVVLLAVRVDNVDPALEALLRTGPEVPLLTLTPFMPSSLERIRTAFGSRVVVAMPGVVAYAVEGGLVRYWLPRAAPTMLDERGSGVPAIRSLCDLLVRAGIPARFEPRVDTMNPATTIAFLPLVLALDVAGGTAERAVADRALMSLALDAVEECRAVAKGIGDAPAWAGVLARFVGPRALRMGIALARRTFPESVTFVERHFGSKTHAQNVLLGREVVTLGRARGLPMSATSSLADRCASRS